MKKIVLIFLLVFAGILAYFLITNNKLQSNQENLRKEVKMKITSSVFENGKDIPVKYTCQGENINPPLKIEEVSEKAISLVLIMDDPDAPSGTFTHWIIFNIDPKIKEIVENSVPKEVDQAKNSAGQSSYAGPCPPSGIHHYYFKLYALDTTLSLGKQSGIKEVMGAINGHIIEDAQLVGLYQRK